MILFDAFKKEFDAVLSMTEDRRKRYLFSFYVGAIFSIILLVASFFFFKTILSALMTPEAIASAAAHGDFTAIRIYAVIAAAFLLLTPIYRYRGTNRTAALVTFRLHRFSLKDYTYSALLKLFGAFEFAPRGGISLIEMRNSTLFPEYQLYLSEDLVVGQMHDVTVKFCEANIVQVRDKKRVSAFKGLLIVCDISETKLKLRGPFQGRTAVVYDAKKHTDDITGKYHQLTRFDLPDAFEPTLEGYTSNEAEAKIVITAELLESIQSLAQKLGSLKQQVEHFDSKLAHASEEFYQHGKEKLTSLVGNSRLPSEIDYDEIHGTGLDITKSDPLSDETSALNQHFELEFYDDKFVVTIPYKHDLFETDSLFEPALNSEDAEVLYGIMQTLDRITKHLNNVKQ